MIDTEALMNVIVPITMFTLMFGMGLTLTGADFKRILQFPRATLMGLTVQLVVSPAIGFGLAYGFDLPLMMAVGLVAVAACPGGTTSNVIVHLGKGDTALSITLTATATMATLLTLPVWINFSLFFFGGGETTIQMPILKTAAQLGLFTVLPVALGMLARKLRPRLLEVEPAITKVSVVAMLSGLLTMAFVDENNTLGQAGQLVAPTLLFILMAVVFGFAVPKMCGVGSRASATIAVETCLKNVLLSLFVATNSLQDLDAALASAVAIVAIAPMAILVMVMYNLGLKHQGRAKAS